jgi:hypothetical protein
LHNLHKCLDWPFLYCTVKSGIGNIEDKHVISSEGIILCTTVQEFFFFFFFFFLSFFLNNNEKPEKGVTTVQELVVKKCFL